MNTRAGLSALLLLVAPCAHGEDPIDAVEEMLTVSALDESVRLRLSGALDLEYFHVSNPPFALLNTERHDLFSPRLTLFLDGQFGPWLYAFVQARIDRGFDPGDQGLQARLDEYALRWTPWVDGRFNLQAGCFPSIVGNWSARHLSWENPFITAPLPYERTTAASDHEVPESAAAFGQEAGADVGYEYVPILWGPVYTTGVSVSGRLGTFEYAAELKNAALSSRPESWNATEVGFAHPSYAVRLGWRPTMNWNLAVSASRGTYLREEVADELPKGRDIGDYPQSVLSQELSFATGHLQIWAECFQARFEIPRVGEGRALGYYVEAKYKFTPAFFGAVRWNQQLYTGATTADGRAWSHDVWRADLALGYRFTAHTQAKVQYSLQDESGPRGFGHMAGVQFTLRF